MRKVLLMGALALVAMVPAANAHLLVGVEPANASCGGTAPADTACDTGSHLRLGAGTFGPGSGDGCPTACNTALPGYTGTLQMNIIYKVHWTGSAAAPTMDQVRTNTCNFSGGVVLSCAVTGAAPPSYPGAVQNVAKQAGGFVTAYDHDCNSFNLGTTTPGGSGPWICFAWHDLLYPQP